MPKSRLVEIGEELCSSLDLPAEIHHRWPLSSGTGQVLKVVLSSRLTGRRVVPGAGAMKTAVVRMHERWVSRETVRASELAPLKAGRVDEEAGVVEQSGNPAGGPRRYAMRHIGCAAPGYRLYALYDRPQSHRASIGLMKNWGSVPLQGHQQVAWIVVDP